LGPQNNPSRKRVGLTPRVEEVVSEAVAGLPTLESRQKNGKRIIVLPDGREPPSMA